MEQTAFEAVMTGVNIFVFIIALTAAIMLMSNVLDMVNYANEKAIVGMNGTVAESVGIVEERTYTGAQVLTYLREYIENENYSFKVKFDEDAQEQEIYFAREGETQNGRMKFPSRYLDDNFILTYKGLSGKKHIYVFTLQNEEIETEN